MIGRSSQASRWSTGLCCCCTGHPLAAGIAVAAFFLTRRLQRRVPGS